ncbi:MAG: M14 family zinc carboxypeptidase [Chryseosolibacter sp.]
MVNVLKKIPGIIIMAGLTLLSCPSGFCFHNDEKRDRHEYLDTRLPANMVIDKDSVDKGLIYINTSFENASPLNWKVNDEGDIVLNLVYDHQRSSLNRSISHLHFQVQARKGSDLTFIIDNHVNIYNGRNGRVSSDRTSLYTSPDGKKWAPIPTEIVNGNSLKFQVHIENDGLYIAMVEPYRVSDLENLLKEINNHPLVKISPLGKTVEGRQLEIIRIGNPDAPYRIFMRGRAHAFEAGGNWLLQGLIRRLLRNDKDAARYLKRYCVYILPMANKDGVARGKSRFNSLGFDLNREWNKPADPVNAPENYALETWLEDMIEKGTAPHLVIDFHNDGYGGLHLSRPPHVNVEKYLARMKRFEALLRQYTWFTEGSTGPNFKDGGGSIGEGVVERYGIDGLVYELNCVWAAGLNKPPLGADWELMGEQLTEVFYHYFDGK